MDLRFSVCLFTSTVHLLVVGSVPVFRIILILFQRFLMCDIFETESVNQDLFDTLNSAKVRQVFLKIREVKFALNRDLKSYFSFEGFEREEVKLNNQSLLIEFWNLILKHFSSIYFDLYNESLEESELRIDSEHFSESNTSSDEEFWSLVNSKFLAWNCFLNDLHEVLRSKIVDEFTAALYSLSSDLNREIKACSEEIWVRKEGER